jgi:uncharacterized membrane protein YjgN (DUF898 family)
MSVPLFDVVFRGVREGFDAPLVREKFAALFKLDSAKTERIFKSKNITLKTHVDERLANIFVARLLAIGVLADKLTIEPVASKAIYTADSGEVASDAFAMHQPVDFVYGEHTRRLPFVFSGTGSEYCKIWLVNLLVSLLSAGILYPWAQVRSLRYFYQHTRLDNIEFQCASNPQKIFLVQFLLVAYLAALIYSFIYAHFYFVVGMIFLLAAFPFYWFKRSQLLCKDSSYYDVNFIQKTTLRDAYVMVLGWPLLVVLSAGLIAPYAAYKMQQYWAKTKSLGNYAFSFNAKPSQYFVLLPSLVMAECVSFMCWHWKQYLAVWGIAIIIAVVWLLVFLRWRVALVNLRWNGVQFGLGYFQCNWSLRTYTKLLITNFLLCSVTLGFYWPWAKVHSAKYKAVHLAFCSNQRFKKWRRNIEI